MTEHIRILTANLLNGTAPAERFAEQLRALRVDVAALQEMGPEQAAAVAEVLPHGKLEPGLDHNGMGIALGRPAEVSRLPLRRRDGRVARLEASDWGAHGPLEIVNVHIQAPHNGMPWTTWSLRRAQVSGLAAYLAEAPCPRRVVVGDFNATPLWPAYRRLVRQVPDETLRHARSRGRRPARTWGPLPGGPCLLRIDHVLAEGVTATHVETVAIEGSDHRGVLVDLEVGGEPA
jgi:endonuclease/exonuclease/phosphatase family metal-dependent hydrolase